MGGLGAWAGCGPAYSLILAVPKVTATRQRPVYQLHIIRCDTIILSNAMHGQNINLSVCVSVCVCLCMCPSHFLSTRYKSDPSMDIIVDSLT